jgi:hypothetical protein
LSWRVGSVECFGLRVLGFECVHWRGANQSVLVRGLLPCMLVEKRVRMCFYWRVSNVSALFLYECACPAWCMSRCWCAGTMHRTDDKEHRNPPRHTPPISRRQTATGSEARDTAKSPRHNATEFATTNNHRTHDAHTPPRHTTTKLTTTPPTKPTKRGTALPDCTAPNTHGDPAINHGTRPPKPRREPSPKRRQWGHRNPPRHTAAERTTTHHHRTGVPCGGL